MTHHRRKHVCTRGLEGTLHIGAHGRRKIRLIVGPDLLERHTVELLGRNVAGDGEHGRTVKHRVGDRHLDGDRAGTDRCECRQRLTAHTVIGIGHEAGGLLVMNRDCSEAILAIQRRIHQSDVAMTAYADHIRDLLTDQVIQNDLGAILLVLLRHRTCSFLPCPGHRSPDHVFFQLLRSGNPLRIGFQSGALLSRNVQASTRRKRGSARPKSVSITSSSGASTARPCPSGRSTMLVIRRGPSTSSTTATL